MYEKYAFNGRLKIKKQYMSLIGSKGIGCRSEGERKVYPFTTQACLLLGNVALCGLSERILDDRGL